MEETLKAFPSRCRRFAGVLLLLALASPALAQTPSTDELPTPAQMKAMQEAKDWAGVLKGATRVLLLKGAAAQPYNRVDVWLMKAEAHLNLNQFVPASDAFVGAAKEPDASPAVADRAFAMSLIARKSDKGGYKAAPSKTDNIPGGQMPILTETDRDAALKALFAAEYAESKKLAEKAKTITLAARFVKQSQATRRIERAADGKDEKVVALSNDVLTAVAKEAKAWVDASTRRVDSIETEAATMVISRDKLGRESMTRKGPSGAQIKEMRDLMKQCETFAKEFDSLKETVGGDPPELADIPSAVNRVYERAKTVSSPSYRAGP